MVLLFKGQSISKLLTVVMPVGKSGYNNIIYSRFDLTKIDRAIDIVVAAEICHLYSMIFFLYKLNTTLYHWCFKSAKEMKISTPYYGVFERRQKSCILANSRQKKVV